MPWGATLMLISSKFPAIAAWISRPLQQPAALAPEVSPWLTQMGLAQGNNIPCYVDATVVETIGPEQPGRIYYQGSWWRAICKQPLFLKPDTPVAVRGRIGLTLIVEPIEMAA
jgi:membrane protein implicated in regulation of membrane protease activity